MATDLRNTLLRQLDIGWALAWYHLETLTTEECLWRPGPVGLHVHRGSDGSWHADWPESEGYAIGPPSIGWVTWHLGFWWSMAIDHAFGAGGLTREQVQWPGDAARVRAWITGCKERWVNELERLDDEALRSQARTRWPFTERPFADLVGWANVELTKNAAELGYARFLYAVRPR